MVKTPHQNLLVDSVHLPHKPTPTAFNTSLAIKGVSFIHSAGSSSSWRNGQMLPTTCSCDAPALTSSLVVFTAWSHQRSLSVRSTTFYSLTIYKKHPPSCSSAFTSNTPECTGFASFAVFTPPQSQSYDLAARQSQDTSRECAHIECKRRQVGVAPTLGLPGSQGQSKRTGAPAGGAVPPCRNVAHLITFLLS